MKTGDLERRNYMIHKINELSSSIKYVDNKIKTVIELTDTLLKNIHNKTLNLDIIKSTSMKNLINDTIKVITNEKLRLEEYNQFILTPKEYRYDYHMAEKLIELHRVGGGQDKTQELIKRELTSTLFNYTKSIEHINEIFNKTRILYENLRPSTSNYRLSEILDKDNFSKLQDIELEFEYVSRHYEILLSVIKRTSGEIKAFVNELGNE